MKTKKEILLSILKAGEFIERMVVKGNSETRRTKVLTRKFWKINKSIFYSECEKDCNINIDNVDFNINEFSDDLFLKSKSMVKKILLNNNKEWKEILNKIDFYIKLNNKLPEKSIKEKTNKI